MPKKVTIDGVETEVFTKEELDAAKGGAEATQKAAIEAAQKEAKEAKEALLALQDKDLNFKNLRELKEAAEKKAEEATKKLQDAAAGVKSEVLGAMLKGEYETMLEKLAGKDQDLRKKIETQYARLADKTETKADVERKLQDAFALASAGAKPPVLHSGVISSVSGMRPKVMQDPVSEEEKSGFKAMAAKGGMVLKDEDITKALGNK